MTQTAAIPCVVFDVDGTLAEFDAERLGHLVLALKNTGMTFTSQWRMPH